MNGGDEGMCIGDDASARMLVTLGRPCPYVELDERNVECLRLFGWLIHDDLKPLVPEYARALLGRRDPGEREAILDRVARALRSREVTMRLHPEAKDERG